MSYQRDSHLASVCYYAGLYRYVDSRRIIHYRKEDKVNGKKVRGGM